MALLAGLVLHQGEVGQPASPDDALMTGTLVSAPADSASKAPEAKDCPDGSEAGSTAPTDQRECADSATSGRLAHSDAH
jgi:hypothetical protein